MANANEPVREASTAKKLHAFGRIAIRECKAGIPWAQLANRRQGLFAQHDTATHINVEQARRRVTLDTHHGGTLRVEHHGISNHREGNRTIAPRGYCALAASDFPSTANESNWTE